MNKMLLFSLFVFFFSCSEKNDNKVSEEVIEEENLQIHLTKEQFENAELSFSVPEFSVLNKSIKVNGVVDVPPQSLVSVSFPLGGYLKSTDLLPGMQVRKGQTLAVFEDLSFIQLQQDYLVEKAKLEFIEGDLKRQIELNIDKINSDKSLEKIKSEFKSQKAIVKGLSEKLQLLTINSSTLSEDNLTRTIKLVSPIDGWVSKVNVNIGKYITPSDVLFELVNPSDIHAALTVFEQDCGKLSIGQKVKLNLVNQKSEIAAKIILFNKNLDANKSVLVHCHFDESHPEILPGMFLSGSIIIDTDSSLVIPSGSLVLHKGKRGVFVQLDDLNYKFYSVQVEVEQMDKIQLDVNSNDLINKRIVSKNAFKLLGVLDLEKEN